MCTQENKFDSDSIQNNDSGEIWTRANEDNGLNVAP